MIHKYMKKPLIIEAVQFDGYNAWAIEQWSNYAVVASTVLEPTPNNMTGRCLQVKTHEGIMLGVVGDWIIKGIYGEFYPCKDSVFKETYISVEV